MSYQDANHVKISEKVGPVSEAKVNVAQDTMDVFTENQELLNLVLNGTISYEEALVRLYNHNKVQ